MNQLAEIKRARSLALAAETRTAGELRSLALAGALLPLGARLTATGHLVLAFAALAVAVAALLRVRRASRAVPMKIALQPGPGRHRWGMLMPLALICGLALSPWSWWTALAASALGVLSALVGVPRHSDARRAAVLARIQGASDAAHPATPDAGAAGVAATPATAPDFSAPGAAELCAVLEVTAMTEVAAVARGLGADPELLDEAARKLDLAGAVRAGFLQVPALRGRLFAELTSAGRQAWTSHVAELERAGAAPIAPSSPSA